MTVERVLLGEEAFQYIETCLAKGRSLARALRRERSGEVSTFASRGTPMSRLTDFRSGGLHAASNDPKTGNVVLIPNFDAELIRLAKRFLDEHADGIFLIEDAIISSFDDEYLDVRTMPTRIRTSAADVFHVAFHGATEDELLNTLRHGRQLPDYVAALTHAPSELMASRDAAKASMELVSVKELGSNAPIVIVGAYDFESFLLWQR